MHYFPTVFINETTDLTNVKVGRCIDYLTRACNSHYPYYRTIKFSNLVCASLGMRSEVLMAVTAMRSGVFSDRKLL
jgi:hypothetical protein